MSNPSWTFIGAGNMAGSLIGGLIASGADAKHIAVVDINAEACQILQDKFGTSVIQSIKHISPGSAVVIAVKPHIVKAVCDDLKTVSPSLVVSVAAGVRADSMANWLPENTPIVRCMPNTPALLGLGATALFANANCNQEQRDKANDLLITAGKTVWVTEEAKLDAVTALSGSGPAYFFYLIEHMADAGKALGLDHDTATDLAIETAYGAASMARARELPPQTLRENVTSKGGTTAAALNSFKQASLDRTIMAAMQAAHDRAKEMGDDFGS